MYPMTKYEIEHGIFEWHCKSCGGYFDNLDIVTQEKTCAFCGSSDIEAITINCADLRREK